MPIQEHYTDTHGYTGLLFGLFALLGFRLAPRLRDLPDQTLYRARPRADYAPPNRGTTPADLKGLP
ncbi:MAG TPA: Tn3 family transposase [Nitriliruptorales bacterium]|nr:Tn3 family transposase [Nitriliruptorales bacterium]